NEEITTYLVKLSKCDLSDKETVVVASTFHVINDIERIGDHAENIADLTSQKIAKKLDYSNQACEQLHTMYDDTIKALDIAIESYANRDCEKARSIQEVEAKIDKLQRKYREQHIQRLYDGTCNAYAGAIFLDLLSNLERIGDHSTNIAENVIENN
ncbi:MAG: PhoU domain-containing protein, partial [Sarcina sp.]